MRSARPWRIRGWSSTTKTVFLAVCMGLSRTIFVVIRLSLRASGGQGEHAGDACPTWRIQPDLKLSADHPRSIRHDVQAHSMTRWMVFLDAGAVVVDDECSPSIFGKQVNPQVARLPVLDGVIHGFLGDVIEMRRHRVVVDQHGRVAFEATADSEEVFN